MAGFESLSILSELKEVIVERASDRDQSFSAYLLDFLNDPELQKRVREETNVIERVENGRKEGLIEGNYED